MSGWIKKYVSWKCGTCQFEGDEKDYTTHMIRQHGFPPNKHNNKKSRTYKGTTKNKKKLFENRHFEVRTKNFVCHECKFSCDLAGNLRVHMHKKASSLFLLL